MPGDLRLTPVHFGLEVDQSRDQSQERIIIHGNLDDSQIRQQKQYEQDQHRYPGSKRLMEKWIKKNENVLDDLVAQTKLNKKSFQALPLTSIEKQVLKSKQNQSLAAFRSLDNTPFKYSLTQSNQQIFYTPNKSFGSERPTLLNSRLTTTNETRLATSLVKQSKGEIYQAPRTALNSDQDELDFNMPNFLVKKESQRRNLPFDVIFEDAQQAKVLDPIMEEKSNSARRNPGQKNNKFIPKLLYCPRCNCERVTIASRFAGEVSIHSARSQKSGITQNRPSLFERIFCCAPNVEEDSNMPSVTHKCRTCKSFIACF